MIEVQCTPAKWWTENTNHVVSAWIAKLFERQQEIPPKRSRLAKLSSTRRGSKGRRIPWSVGYQEETGKVLMKTKVGTEGRREAYARLRTFPLRRFAESAISLDVYSLVVSSIAEFSPNRKRRWKTRVEGLSLTFPFSPAARHSERGKSTLELNLFLAMQLYDRDPSFPLSTLYFYPFFLTRNIERSSGSLLEQALTVIEFP